MNDTPDTQPQLPPLTINGQYIKDLSFESPNAPDILVELQNEQPDVSVNVDVKASQIEGPDDTKAYEVILDIKAELKLKEKIGFIIELQFAGIFSLNVAEEHISALLLIECPRMLFPYARNTISEITRDGGFMPLYLQPIDFAGMYQANLQRQAEAQQADTETVN